jgi:pimeloyl-ACP methyl ester carboxylesterase
VLGAFVPNDAGAAYDWIGFDPRGVGSSVPALSCDPQYFAPTRPDYEIPTRAVERQWLSRSEGYADACDAAGGRLLRHMKTTDSVADMEALRRALGEEQINYYGYSYGTYLGQVYATLHPDRVRRMVLDANVDPTRVWYQANLDQDFAFDRNINLWFEWLAQYDDVYHLGTTAAAVSQLWYTQREAFKAAPAGQIGPDEWTDIFLTVGYAQGSWPYFGDVFANWIATGDPAPLLDEYLAAEGVGDDNNFAVYLAVQCTDVQWPKKFSTWKRDNLAVAAQAPFFTWSNAWFNAPCLYWPAKAGEPVNVRGRKAPPVLLLSETLDAATPFSGTLKVRSLFPKASLVSTPGGTTHASSLFGTVCVAEYVADYLATGALPARQPGNVADAECAPDPEPLPFELQTTVATATSRVAGTDVAAELRQRLSRRFPG